MRVMRKAVAIVLTLALAIPAIVGTEAVAKKAKAPSMLVVSTELLPDTSSQITIESNGAKIIKTTWKTSNKKVVKISKQKKLNAKIKTGSAGNTSAKVTATVKYKVGKKVKTKKLTCTVKVIWLDVDSVSPFTSSIDGHTVLAAYMNATTPIENINKFDTVPEEGEIFIGGEWNTNASSVVEVLDTTASASGTAVTVESVAVHATEPVVYIDLGKEVTEKASYSITLMGFKGCGSKMMIQTTATVEPNKVTITGDGFANPEKKGNIVIFLHTDKAFDVGTAGTYLKENNDKFKWITVKDANGKELPVTDVTPVSYPNEGDHVIINLEGGADSKKFTVELTSAFLANFMESGAMYLAEKTITVDKEIDLNTATPDASATPAASATPDASATPAVSATPDASATPAA